MELGSSGSQFKSIVGIGLKFNTTPGRKTFFPSGSGVGGGVGVLVGVGVGVFVGVGVGVLVAVAVGVAVSVGKGEIGLSSAHAPLPHWRTPTSNIITKIANNFRLLPTRDRRYCAVNIHPPSSSKIVDTSSDDAWRVQRDHRRTVRHNEP